MCGLLVSKTKSANILAMRCGRKDRLTSVHITEPDCVLADVWRFQKLALKLLHHMTEVH